MTTNHTTRQGRAAWAFSQKTRNIIAARAAYRCSFPGCDQILIGPGNGRENYVNTAEVSHVHSGHPRGPRFAPNLQAEYLRSTDNGILLCRHHHKVIDSLESTFTAEQVRQMKHKHEFRIGAALGSIHKPLVWLDSIRLDDFLLFSSGTTIKLGRVNQLTGPNGSGKTALLEVMNSAIMGLASPRWTESTFTVNLALSSFNQTETNIGVHFERRRTRYTLNSDPVGTFPSDFTSVFLRQEPKGGLDDIESLNACYDFPTGLLERLVVEGLIPGVTTSGYRIETKRERPYLHRELVVNVGKRKPQFFKTCSSSEQARVVLDLGIAVAAHTARFRPVLLLLDWQRIWQMHVEAFKPYVDYLFSNQALFQTIFVSPERHDPIDWHGWQQFELVENGPQFEVRQLH